MAQPSFDAAQLCATLQQTLSGDQATIKQATDTLARNLIIPKHGPASVCVLLAACISVVAVPQILALLQQDNQPTVFSALWALRVLVKKYEYKAVELRQPLNDIIQQSFPLLLHLMGALQQRGTLECAEMMKLICKIFYSSTHLTLSQSLTSPDVFGQWITLLHNILVRPVTEQEQPRTADERKEYPWWNCKKWVVHIMYRLFQRYGDPKLCEDEMAGFAKMFQEQCAGRILESLFQHVLEHRFLHHQYVPDRLVLLALNYAHTAINHGVTWRVLKPRVDFLLFQVVFPLLCFDAEDQRLWQEDPLEYVRKLFDVLEDFYSPRVCACNVLTDMVTIRSAATLDRTMAFLGSVLQRYLQTPPAQRNASEKDGALFAIGTLWESPKVKKKAGIAQSLENLLHTHVAPEFQSPHGFLRARACWIAGVLADIPFSSPQSLTGVLHSILACLRDREVPVRINAALALRKWIEREECTDVIRPSLPLILQEFFRLLDELDNEELVNTLELIVDRYSSELAPYAVVLAQKLSEAFTRMVLSEDAEDEDSSSALVAVECLRALTSIISSAKEMPQLFAQLEVVLLPMLLKMIADPGLDYLEELLDIVASLTFYAPAISANMWSVFQRLVESACEFAIDFLQFMLLSFRNFIGRAPQEFVQRNGPTMILTVFKHMLEQGPSEADKSHACKLWEIVLHNCRGMVDGFVSPALALAVQALTAGVHTSAYKVCNSIYYNASLTLKLLEGAGVTQQVFGLWLHALSKFKGIHDKKLVILAILSILSMQPAEWPPVVAAGIGFLYQALLTTLMDITTLRKQEEESDEDSDEADSDEDDSDADDQRAELGDDDRISDQDAAYLRSLTEKVQRFRAEHPDSDSDSDMEENVDVDESIISPIDDLDELVLFLDLMTALNTSNRPLHDQLVASLGSGSQMEAKLVALMQEATVHSLLAALLQKQQ